MASDVTVVDPLSALDRFTPEDTIRIRVSPQLFNRQKQRHGGYDVWRGVSWISVVRGPETARRWLETINLFFTVLPQVGTERVQAALKALQA